MPEDHSRDSKPAVKRKSPDSVGPDRGSPNSTRNDLSNNNVGNYEDGAVLGVPVKMVQSNSHLSPPKSKSSNGAVESCKPTEDGENRARLVWSQELHNRFLNALSHLGLKRAVPKSILGLMEVDGMTRENIASHLQKYRIYLKKLGGFSSKDKVSVEQLQDLHEENIRQMAMQEAMQDVGLSIDESDSNVLSVKQPRLRNVVDGIPITGSMPIGMSPNALKQVEMELLDPRNLQYPAVHLVPSVGQVVGMQSYNSPTPQGGQHGHDPHDALHHEDLELRSFEERALKATGIDEKEVKEERENLEDQEPLLIETAKK